MRLPIPWIATFLAVLVSACSAAPNGEVGASTEPAVAAGHPLAVQPATPAPPAPALPSAGEPPPAAAEKGATPAQEVDYSCTVDADCAVKDVGNCCGYYPACVNADSPTFPEQVKAECARSGTMSVCGFPTIEGCQCVDNRCQAAPAALQKD